MSSLFFAEGLVKFFSAGDLANFVSTVDSLGGPASVKAAEYWQGLRYRPAMNVDVTLDPFSEAYVAQQLLLFKEIAGRDAEQSVTELTDFDFDRHVNGANPYAIEAASEFAVHYLRLAHVVAAAPLPPRAKVLDMGAGWGMSSEFLATLGCSVRAVDINPKFVDLIGARQKRHGLPITARVGTFDDYVDEELFDAVLFYECLHHAIRPWSVLARARGHLKPGGVILFAGEPINDYWASWGLRLDPLSIYCIAKFGWFESGWSQGFISECLVRIGMRPFLQTLPNNSIGSFMVARQVDPAQGFSKISPADLRMMAGTETWIVEPEHLISMGNARLDVRAPKGHTRLNLVIQNYRGKPIPLVVRRGGVRVVDTSLQAGKSLIAVPVNEGANMIEMISEVWIPGQELGNHDTRSLSFHLTEASFT